MYEIKTAKVNTLVRCAAAAFASLEVGVWRGRGGGVARDQNAVGRPLRPRTDAVQDRWP